MGRSSNDKCECRENYSCLHTLLGPEQSENQTIEVPIADQSHFSTSDERESVCAIVTWQASVETQGKEYAKTYGPVTLRKRFVRTLEFL
jgi:hypothetical protein